MVGRKRGKGDSLLSVINLPKPKETIEIFHIIFQTIVEKKEHLKNKDTALQSTEKNIHNSKLKSIAVLKIDTEIFNTLFKYSNIGKHLCTLIK